MTWLRITQRLLRLTAHILVGLLLTPLIQTPVGGVRRSHPAITCWWHSRVADILGVTISVQGYRPHAPALLAANHVSWLDIVVLGSLTPTGFLSKHEVSQWPIVGWLADRAGTLFIRRGDGEAGAISEQIAARLSGQTLLTLFPEGTTTDGREVRTFFSRLFGAAVDSGTPVIPVALRYHIDGAYDPIAPYIADQSLIDNLTGLLRRERTQVYVWFGDPIALHGHSRKAAAGRARAEIVAALRRHEQGRHMDPATNRAVA